MAGYLNRFSIPLVVGGVTYAPGDTIPATADPAQLAYFAAQGIVEPTTAPAPIPPPLRRVTHPTAVDEEVPDGGSDDRSV